MRSSVSGSVVNSSRGKPENAESAVFSTTRFASPETTSRAVAVARDDGGPVFAAGLHERVRMRAARHAERRSQRCSDDADADALDTAGLPAK